MDISGAVEMVKGGMKMARQGLDRITQCEDRMLARDKELGNRTTGVAAREEDVGRRERSVQEREDLAVPLEESLRQLQQRVAVSQSERVKLNVGGTVFPFILRGVNLLGIDSANYPMADRVKAWARLAGELKPRHLEQLARTIPLADLPAALKDIAEGGARGRYVVQVGA